jgi:hypothetical protein
MRMDMKRKLLTLSALVSLMLAAATGLWWMRSASKVDQVTLDRTGKDTLRLWGTDGKLLVTRTTVPMVAPTRRDDDAKAPPAPVPTAQLRWASFDRSAPNSPAADPKFTMTAFSFASQPLANTAGVIESTFVVPVWMIMTAFSVLPVLWVSLRFRKKPNPAHA